MSDPVNIVQLVRDLPSRPRGRACIVLTHDYDGQRKWAAELARQTDSEHLDLLQRFVHDEELASRIGQFMVSDLFEFLRRHDRTRVLVVSGMEFLKAAWSGQSDAVEQFASQVEFWDKKPCLVFVLQYDRTIAGRAYRRFPQYTFVVDQKETLAL